MLDSLYAGAIADASARQALLPIRNLEELALAAANPIDAIGALSSGDKIRVIAEIKRASPSRGKLSEIANAAELASVYEHAGAAAISVLTEERSFLGSLDDLRLVSSMVNIPILRKDFIANEYQILEARAFGADIVLLIAAGLKEKRLRSLHDFARSLGLTVLLETHNEQEVRLAADMGSQLVGINARDLTTFETDRNLFAKLVDLLPKECVKVAESAVRSADDVQQYASAGADCVLVGEALVTGDADSLIQAFSSISKV